MPDELRKDREIDPSLSKFVEEMSTPTPQYLIAFSSKNVPESVFAQSGIQPKALM